MKIDKNHKFSEFFTKNDENQRKIEFLVLHHIEENSVEGAILELKEHKVSSHFLISEDGVIYELVAENDIAYHAGYSFWRDVDGLNATSIGIEFINPQAFSCKFKKLQMQAGVKLCHYLIAKYNIKPENIVGHSDIAYDPQNHGFLDRKQDPSQFFDWRFLAKNKIGIFPTKRVFFDRILFKIGDKNAKIAEIKQKLANFGYKVTNFNDEFDEEMQALTRVFNRRFVQKCDKKSQFWRRYSQKALDSI